MNTCPLTLAAVSVVLIGGDGVIQGATTTYTDRGTFNAAALYGPITTDGYETYPNDLVPGARTITLGSFSVSYNLTGDDSQFGITDVPNPFGGSGVGPTAGSKYLDANFPTSGGPSGVAVTFMFGTGIHAFATDIKDLENANLSYITSSGASGTAAAPGSDGNVQFFGIISDTTFTTVAFSEPPAITGDGVVFDQTSFAAPEPSSLSILCILGGLAYYGRKRITINNI